MAIIKSFISELQVLEYFTNILSVFLNILCHRKFFVYGVYYKASCIIYMQILHILKKES